MTDVPQQPTQPPKSAHSTEVKEAKGRHHSEKRKRTKLTAHRWTMDEFNEAAARARDAGLTFGAYVRASATGSPGARAQRSLPVDAELLRRLQTLHIKYGTNLNQIAYQLNANGMTVLEADFRTALKEWGILRDLNQEALNKRPPGGSLLAWDDLVAEAKDILTAHPGAKTISVPAAFLRRIVGENNAPSAKSAAPVRSNFLPPAGPSGEHPGA
jgi:hypothetical protein